MSNVIIIKNSSTVSDVPTVGQLEQGELAINLLDEKLYSKNSSNVIFEIGGSIGGSITDNQIAVGAATADSIEGSANLTFDGTTLDTNDRNIDMGEGRLDVKTIYATGTTGGIVRIYGSGGTAYFSMLHNNVDINLAGLGGTVDMNITGLTAINAGTVDAAFDNVTATDFNAVALTAVGSATSFLNAAGTYTTPAGTLTGTGANDQIAVWTGTSALEGTGALTFGGTQAQISSAAPFWKFEETGVTGTPVWWWGADGGAFSMRLNNTGAHALTINTNAGNDTITGVVFPYNTDFSAGIDVTGNITVTGTVDGKDVSTLTSNTGTVTSVGGTAPVVSSGGTAPSISMAAATTSVNGYLTSTDWTTFNNKTSNTGTVTGTGVNNQVSLWSGTSSQDGSANLTFSAGNELSLGTAGTISLQDNNRIGFGTGFDGQISYDSAGDELQIECIGVTDVGIYTAATDLSLLITANAGVGLYYNNVLKFLTTTTGATLTGNMTVTGTVTASGNINANGNIVGDGATTITGIEEIVVDATADIRKTSHGCYLYHASTAYDNDQNGQVTFSTAAASGGTTGDIWFQYTA